MKDVLDKDSKRFLLSFMEFAEHFIDYSKPIDEL